MNAPAFRRRRARFRAAVVLAACALVPGVARAVMDINDRGPVLDASGYTLRVTNIGALGNAFYDVGLSSDPSFEYPRGSGNELLKHAELWVGALDENGRGRVSGGPLTEWRPTLAPDDRVRIGWRGRLGSRRGVDDDGDGQVDEERFNGRDDDGDGEVDEDLAFPSDEVAASDYRDDQPEAIDYGYPNGEVHHAFGLDVHEEDYAWSLPGYEGIAGIQYVITNHSERTIHGLYVGLLADLDARTRDQATGHLDDQVVQRTATRTFSDGNWFVTVNGIGPQVSTSCFRTVSATVPVVVDADTARHLPAVTVIGLGHTTDPLALLDLPVARQAARAPGRESFLYQKYRADLPPGQGGLPVLDGDRYAALQGTFPQNLSDQVAGDQATLVSCGPFPSLAPGQSIEFAVALCAAPDADSLVASLRNAITLYRGFVQNRLPDSTGTEYNSGATGKSGHEVCLDPPPGVSFDWDPHCAAYWALAVNGDVPEVPAHYEHGHCVWTNADCDPCTGMNGFETRVRWLDPGSVPPSPVYVAAPGDHRVTVTWDNMPEILLRAGIVGAGGYNFAGYRVYRLSDWRDRRALLPPPDHWEEIAAFGPDSLNGQRPLAAVTDTTVTYDLIRFGQKHYPVGRYRLVDDHVLNGFDYIYVVTTLASRDVLAGGATITERIESPLVSSLDSLVVPHTAAAGSAGRVWVVPNPYRASSPWDRPRVPGDVFGRHVDFMGLPKARCTIKIWTLAGDLVAQLDHDGSGGDGQAPWNLISRNGQDVESGIYLFTVDSSLGKQIGKFVLIR